MSRPLSEYTKGELRKEVERYEKQLALMLEHDRRQLESDSIVASCGCLTKTNEVRFHKTGCKYRLICERDEARSALTAANARVEALEGERDVAERRTRSITAELHGKLTDARTRITTLEKQLREARKDGERLKWVRKNCRLVFYPPDGAYPIEHAPHAGKDMWEALATAADTDAARRPDAHP